MASIYDRLKEARQAAAEESRETREREPDPIIIDQPPTRHAEPQPLDDDDEDEDTEQAITRPTRRVKRVPKQTRKAIDLSPGTSLIPRGLMAWVKLGGALFIWLWGLNNTNVLFAELAGASVAWYYAFIGQCILTALQSDLWSGRRSLLNVGAMFIDAGTNVVGTWLLVPNIFKTQLYAIIRTATASIENGTTVYHLPATVGLLPQLIIAFVLGILIAWTPEALAKSATSR